MSWDLPGFQTRRVSRDAAPALAQPPPLKTCMAHSWDSYVPVQAKEVAQTTVRKRGLSPSSQSAEGLPAMQTFRVTSPGVGEPRK